MQDRLTQGLLAGGISQQPEHLRAPGQWRDGVNMIPDVAFGVRRRPGTRHIATITAANSNNDYQLHKIDRDPAERYAVIKGPGSELYVINMVGGGSATITPTADATAYMTSGSPTAFDFRLVTLLDTTYIVNTKVVPAQQTSVGYANVVDWRDYDVMTSHTPLTSGDTAVAPLTYHRTTMSSGDEQPGYYQYLPGYKSGDSLFGVVIFPEITTATWATPSGDWDLAGAKGFGIRFDKRQAPSAASASWNNTTKVMTFNSTQVETYVYEVGDDLYVSGGTGWTPGFYRITGKVSNTALLLDPAISVASSADVSTENISRKYDVTFDATSGTLPSMEDVALFVQGRLRFSGAVDACVSWRSTGVGRGRFIITSPIRGGSSRVHQTTACTTAPAAGTNLSAINTPFYATGATFINGAGSGSRSLAVESRWQRVAVPDQEGAVLNPATMPIAMIRTGTSPLAFEVKLIDWNPRTIGDNVSNPAPKALTQGKVISDVAIFENRLAIGVGDRVVLSRTNDFYNFYRESVIDVLATDPIDVVASGAEYSAVQYLLPARRSLLVTTNAAAQYEITYDQSLRPEDVQVTQSTSIQTINVSPVRGNQVVYLASAEGAFGRIHETYVTEGASSTVANDITEHIPTLISQRIRRIAYHAATGSLLVLANAATGLSTSVYMNASYWAGVEKRNTGWTRFAMSALPTDITIIGDDLVLLTRESSTARLTIEAMELSPPAPSGGLTWAVHSDRRLVGASGVHSAGTTTWTIATSRLDPLAATVVLTSGAFAGTQLGGTLGGSPPNITVSVTGNYAGESCEVGRQFTSSITLTRPFVADERGQIDLDKTLSMNRMAIIVLDSGLFQTIQDYKATVPSDNTLTLAPDDPISVQTRTYRVPFRGDVGAFDVRIQTLLSRPLTISGVQRDFHVFTGFR